MKKRWIVLIVAAAVSTVVMAAGTAMAAERQHSVYRQHTVQQYVQQGAQPEQAAAEEATPSTAPPPTSQPTPQPTQATAAQSNTGCPQHRADCPDDCMWYNDGAGCSLYGDSTGTCPWHDGYCNTESGRHEDGIHYGQDGHGGHHNGEEKHHSERHH